MATKNTYNTKNTSKNMDEDANDSQKRFHLSGPLSVDPVSQQLIDSKYVLNFGGCDCLGDFINIMFFEFPLSGRIRIFHGVNFVCKAPPWWVFSSHGRYRYYLLNSHSWYRCKTVRTVTVKGIHECRFGHKYRRVLSTLGPAWFSGIGLSCWKILLHAISTPGDSTL